jgi:hypothetical protein
MKAKHLLLGLIAACALVFSCHKPDRDLSYPSVEINLNSTSVEKPASTFTMMVLANRAWRATADVPWIAVDPDNGPGDPFGQTVTVTVMENTSYTRSGHLVFDIVYDNATLLVEQAGNGSPEDFVIYFNDFDKETATQSYGSSGTSWPFLDQFEGWKNQSGVGLAGMTYDFANVSARNNSNSNGSFSDYAGSGLNNLLFGANGHIAVKNLSLQSFKNFRLSFGTEKYDNNDKTALFNPAEMPVYLSADGQKWVPLTYTYLGTAAGRWNVAEAVFSVPSEVTSLSVYVMATIASAYRLDDLKIEVSEEAGPVIDFSNGTDLPSGGGGGGGGDTPGGNPSGSGTLADPYNPSGAANAVKDLTWTSNTVYDKTDKVYVKGKISRIASSGRYTESGTFGNASFYISDDGSESGEFFAYRILYFGGQKYTSGPDIKVGDEVIIYGELMNYKGNTPETVSGKACLYSLNGSTGGDTPGPGPGGNEEIKTVTIAEFLAAPVSSTQWYKLTGTVSNIVMDKNNPDQYNPYGNFDLTDEAGSKVYIYGLCASKVDSNDKSFISLGISEGMNITIATLRAEYKGEPQGGGTPPAYLISINGDDPGPGPEPGGDFTSNVTWTAGSDNSYDQDATVNGTTGVKVLKLGKGSDYGKSTLTLPAGSTTLSFYAVSWNNADVANLVFSVNGQEVATVTPKANSGLAGNPTYTLTVSDSDHYTVDLGSATTTVEVKTAGGYRAALFGIIAK